MIQENEIPKYLKQKESNISKSNRKSKHKHQYEECLIQHNFQFAGKECTITNLSSYCTICGKVGHRLNEDKSIVKDYVKEIYTSVGKCYSVSPGEELYKRYHNKLPVFVLDDVCGKYVCLEDKNSDRE